MQYMRIPITVHIAEQFGYDRDQNGYARVEFLVDSTKMGKFVSFMAESVNDCEINRPLILKKESLFDRLRQNDIQQLSASKNPESYIKLLTRLSRCAKRWSSNDSFLLEHDIVEYQWEPFELPTHTPEVWLMTQCSKIRSLGLCYRVGSKTPPVSILNSMGIELKNYAIEKQIL